MKEKCSAVPVLRGHSQDESDEAADENGKYEAPDNEEKGAPDNFLNGNELLRINFGTEVFLTSKKEASPLHEICHCNGKMIAPAANEMVVFVITLARLSRGARVVDGEDSKQRVEEQATNREPL